MMKAGLLVITLLCASAPCFAQDTPMPAAALEMGCNNCHAVNRRVVGPAWMEVSKRYRDKRADQATFDALVDKVSRGGSGNWGTVPMVASDPAGKHQEQIRELVRFVLSLSAQPPEYKAQR